MVQDEVENAIDAAIAALVKQGAEVDQIIGALHLKAVELERGIWDKTPRN